MAHYTYEHVIEVPADPLTIWPAIANSKLLSELNGDGRYRAVDELQPDGSVIRRAEGDKMAPLTRQWTEDLGEWVLARSCRQTRRFGANNADFVDYAARLEPIADKTRVTFRLEVKAAGMLPWLGVRLGFMQRAVKRVVALQQRLIEAMITAAPEDAHRPASDPMTYMAYEPPALSEQAAARLPKAKAYLQKHVFDHGLIARFCDFLTSSPEAFLQRIRPFALADQWQVERGLVADLFLLAHEAGLVSLRWEVLCPHCRGTHTPAENLANLSSNLHCSSCNLNYERDFSRNVELLFTPEPWLRQISQDSVCMLGAASADHILVQRHVAAGATCTVTPPLRPSSYRIRAPQIENQLELDLAPDTAFPAIQASQGQLHFSDKNAPAGADRAAILLQNDTAQQVTFIIEEMTWRNDALTGDQVIARSAFRRYCPDQLLRPGDDVNISNVVLLFTDLKGSTSLYEHIGDAAAYKLVRDHFDYLTQIVEDNNGCVVKTIGDAIMAAFSDCRDAADAAIALQSGVVAFNAGREDGGVVLKAGLHQGRCIGVTSGGHLDYFGSMVNMAARLQSQSDGQDIVLSRAIADAVDLQSRMPADRNWQISQETGALKGIAHPVTYYRIQFLREATGSPER